MHIIHVYSKLRAICLKLALPTPVLAKRHKKCFFCPPVLSGFVNLDVKTAELLGPLLAICLLLLPKRRSHVPLLPFPPPPHRTVLNRPPSPPAVFNERRTFPSTMNPAATKALQERQRVLKEEKAAAVLFPHPPPPRVAPPPMRRPPSGRLNVPQVPAVVAAVPPGVAPAHLAPAPAPLAPAPPVPAAALRPKALGDGGGRVQIVP